MYITYNELVKKKIEKKFVYMFQYFIQLQNKPLESKQMTEIKFAFPPELARKINSFNSDSEVMARMYNRPESIETPEFIAWCSLDDAHTEMIENADTICDEINALRQSVQNDALTRKEYDVKYFALTRKMRMIKKIIDTLYTYNKRESVILPELLDVCCTEIVRIDAEYIASEKSTSAVVATDTVSA